MREIAELLPNPRFESERFTGLDLTEHWLPKARGGASAAGISYFTGRKRALSELVSWLTAPQGDGRARVITGSPGAGKSAVPAHLVTLSNSQERSRIETAGLTARLDVVPPVGCIHLAIHARGKTLDDLAHLLGESLLPDWKSTSDLIEALKVRAGTFVFVVDALDEAVDPFKIARELLRQIAPLPAVRLLVASRPDGAPGKSNRRVLGLGAATVEIDLDRDLYIEPQDIETYVFRRLLAADEPALPTPYRNRPDLAHAVAQAVAKRSGNVFLIARIVSDALIVERTPQDIANPSELRFPGDIGEAFDNLFETFNQAGDIGKKTVIDLLRPLAYAEGAGLPWESLWAPLASTLAGFDYVDDDIGAMLKRAAGFIVEDFEEGRSVYRVYHQELANYLCQGRDSGRAQLDISSMLVSSVPVKDTGGTDWLNADPYVLTHLVTHAAKGGMLDALLLDPLFLQAADRQRLIRVLPSGGCDETAQAALAYRLAYHHLAEPDPFTRLSYLQLTALTNGCSPNSWLSAAVTVQPWRAAWANWQNEVPHWAIVVQSQSRDTQRYFTSHVSHISQRAISAVVITRLGEILVAVSGSVDGTLRLWRLSDGAPLTPVVVAHEAGVNQIAAVEITNQLVILSVGNDGTLALWEPQSELTARCLYDGSALYAVAARQVGDRWIAAFSGADLIVRLVDIETGVLDSWHRELRDPAVYSLAIDEIDGTPVILAGGSLGEVQCWLLDTEMERPQSYSGHHGAIMALNVTSVEGIPHIASVDRKGVVIVWEIGGKAKVQFETGHEFTPTKGWLVTACFAKTEDRVLLAAGDYSGVMRVVDLGSRAPVLEPIVTEMGQVTSMALSSGDDLALVSGDNTGMLRVWSAKLGAMTTPANEAIGHIRSLATGCINGQMIAAAGSMDGRVHFLNTADGSPIRQCLLAQSKHVQGLSFVEINGLPNVVTGSPSDNYVRCWNLSGDQPVCQPIGPFAGIFAIEAIPLGNNPTIAFEGLNHEIILWDLVRSVPIGPALKGHSETVYCLDWGKLDSRLLLASSGADCTIWLWDIAVGAAYRTPINAQTAIAALAFGRQRGRTVLFAGDYNGRISIWNPDDGQMVGGPFSVHVEPVNTIAIGSIDGNIVGISGSADSTVVVWRPTGEVLTRIELGAWVMSIKPAEDRIIVGTAKGVVAISVPGLSFGDRE